MEKPKTMEQTIIDVENRIYEAFKDGRDLQLEMHLERKERRAKLTGEVHFPNSEYMGWNFVDSAKPFDRMLVNKQ